MIKYILTFALVITWGSTAWISISALVQFLPESGFIIYVIGFSLEFGKAASIVFIHRSWSRSNIIKKFYYTITISILVILTACEVTGYLSNGHSESILNHSKIETELTQINNEKDFLKHQIELIEKNLNDFPEGYGTKRIAVREQTQLDKKLERMNELLIRESELSVSEIATSNQSPIITATNLFNIDPNKTASFFIIILVCVLEMLSTGLTLAVSHVWQIKKQVSKIGNQNIETVSEVEEPVSGNDNFIELTEINTGSDLYVFFKYLLGKYKLSIDKIISITGKSKNATVESWVNGETEIPLKELYKITNYIGELNQNTAA